MGKIEIGQEFCFDPRKKLTAKISSDALKIFVDGHEDAIKLKGDCPIFLDANMLLGYYGIAQKEKTKLLDFIKTYKSRIIITAKVEQEYLKNRLNLIRKDYFPLTQIANEYEGMCYEVKKVMRDYTEKKKRILELDYPVFWAELLEIQKETDTTINHKDFGKRIREEIEKANKNYKHIVYQDELLDLVASLIKTPELSSEEIEFIKKLYNDLMHNYKNNPEETRRFIIPGGGDKKLDPSGDLIIFHEMLKYMKEKNTSCIFLTNDITKGDWLQLDKNAHTHYLEHSFNMTGNIVFIVKAEKMPTAISFENIHSERTDMENSLSQDVAERIASSGESHIVSIYKNGGYIFSKNGNILFNEIDLVNCSIENLLLNNVVRFAIATNAEGQIVAKSIEKISYSFQDERASISTGPIATINHEKGIGYISRPPQNLCFHSTSMESPGSFDSLKKGQFVDYIVGLNLEGEEIARLVRASKPITS